MQHLLLILGDKVKDGYLRRGLSSADWFKLSRCHDWKVCLTVEVWRSGREKWFGKMSQTWRQQESTGLLFALIMKRHAAGTLEWWFIIHLKEYGLISLNSCSQGRSDCVFPVIIPIIFFLHIHPDGRSFCSSWLKLNRLWSFTALGKLCLVFLF